MKRGGFLARHPELKVDEKKRAGREAIPALRDSLR
jgi:hypothetical protein